MTTQENLISEYPDLLDARMISEIFRISYVKALHMIKYGGIPYLKLGNTYRVSRLALIALISQEGQMQILFNQASRIS